MSPSLERAWQEYARGSGYPRICGGCREWFCPPPGKVGHPDAEGLVFIIGGSEVDGADLNICGGCAMKALMGWKPFRRNGVRVEMR